MAVPPGLLALAVLPLAFLALPLGAMIWRTLSSEHWLATLRSAVVTQALVLSLGTTGITLLIVVLGGTPLAYLLARYRFRGAGLIDTLVDLPMVLPPAVAGLALLMLFGRQGLLGPLGLDVAFSTAAVVLAQTFVAAPFYVRAARAGFESVDPMLERVATTLGESGPMVFLRVTVPVAWPSLLGGAVMTWARALGEFGATIMFAGNFSGRTQTMPLAIYTALESDLWAALTLALLLMALSFVALVALKLAAERAVGRSRAP
jgi:molybdate transport system permease protein